jgi:hypothetical protein
MSIVGKWELMVIGLKIISLFEINMNRIIWVFM